MPPLNTYEKGIINTLYNAARPLTTTQVAKSQKIAWATANKYLARLFDDGYLEKRPEGNKTFWRLSMKK
jgi:Mn-dependent DtxR family transcriptional regulator